MTDSENKEDANKPDAPVPAKKKEWTGVVRGEIKTIDKVDITSRKPER
jgi:hypothetical protein